MGKRTVVNACVTDIEKRREPSKHYVYIIHVTWSDGSVNVIYRRYSTFFDLQVKILGQFPDEAGTNNPSARCIPFLPGKILFGRSHVREVALKRLKPLDEYCQILCYIITSQALVKLPSKISDCSTVIQFFTPSPEDVSPPSADGESRRGKEIDSISEPIQAEQYVVVANYKKQQKNEVDLTAGDLVEVFEKNDNGWWFVTINDQHGWAPGTFLQKPDGQEEEEEETLLPGNSESSPTIGGGCSGSGGVGSDAGDGRGNGGGFDGGVDIEVMMVVIMMVMVEVMVEIMAIVLMEVVVETVGELMVVEVVMMMVEAVMETMVELTMVVMVEMIVEVMVVVLIEVMVELMVEVVVEVIVEVMVELIGVVMVGVLVEMTVVMTVMVEVMVMVVGNETYITNNAYKAQADDEISFQTGVVVNILQKSLDGWWKISYQGKQGWAPATYLQIYKGPTGVMAKPPTQSIGNVMLLKGDSSNDRQRNRPGPASGSGPGVGFRPPVPTPQEEEDSDNIYLNYDMPAESKPTPPRRSTVRKSSARRGATRNTKMKQKKVVEYYTIADFEGAAGEGSLSFKEGEKAEVREETAGGWWYVTINGQEGWAPSTYIEKREVPAGRGGRSTGPSGLASLDEETGEQSGPPALPSRPKFGGGGAFKPLTSSNKPSPPPINRSNSPSASRSSAASNASSPTDVVSALKKQFDKSSVSESPSRPSGPKPPKPASQPYCNRDAVYVTTSSYVNDENDGLSFEAGEKVEVIKRDGSGWWLVRIGSQEGWAPSTYMEKA
ncbi:SH3 and PX domain-containing protein 2A-like [Diadema antillarum]|uniref:SH3 and PX domain-containing protein 2A-like n=1 Tax=Diadema antillarum TaxID=105358 RepID=UPI003A83C672